MGVKLEPPRTDDLREKQGWEREISERSNVTDIHLANVSNPHSVTAVQASAIEDAADQVKDTHIDWGSGSGQVDTDDVPEGSSNLYHTDERVDDRVGALIQDGDALTFTYDDGAGTLTGEVTKAVAVSDVATANADATYGTAERDLINELKTQVNDLLAKLRTAKLLAT